MGRKRTRRLNNVDVVLGQSFGWGERKTGPDDRVRINGWYEEGEGGGRDVIGEVTIGKGTAREIEEVPSLTVPPKRPQSPKRGSLATNFIFFFFIRSFNVEETARFICTGMLALGHYLPEAGFSALQHRSLRKRRRHC